MSEGAVVEEMLVSDGMICDRFTHKQRLAIELLGRGDLKYGEVARSVGVSEVTLGKWRKDTDFANEIQLYRSRRSNERRSELLDRLDAAEMDAVGVLMDLLKSEKDSIRLKAAVEVIKTKLAMSDSRDGAIEVQFQGMPAPSMPVHDIHKGEV